MEPQSRHSVTLVAAIAAGVMRHVDDRPPSTLSGLGGDRELQGVVRRAADATEQGAARQLGLRRDQLALWQAVLLHINHVGDIRIRGIVERIGSVHVHTTLARDFVGKLVLSADNAVADQHIQIVVMQLHCHRAGLPNRQGLRGVAPIVCAGRTAHAHVQLGCARAEPNRRDAVAHCAVVPSQIVSEMYDAAPPRNGPLGLHVEGQAELLVGLDAPQQGPLLQGNRHCSEKFADGQGSNRAVPHIGEGGIRSLVPSVSRLDCHTLAGNVLVSKAAAHAGNLVVVENNHIRPLNSHTNAGGLPQRQRLLRVATIVALASSAHAHMQVRAVGAEPHRRDPVAFLAAVLVVWAIRQMDNGTPPLLVGMRGDINGKLKLGQTFNHPQVGALHQLLRLVQQPLHEEAFLELLGLLVVPGHQVIIGHAHVEHAGVTVNLSVQALAQDLCPLHCLGVAIVDGQNRRL
mmetsp:Transcript_6805/g.14529  ORF Transcript_6805/g.14529 Transcript_6805/m.14529 type:complete len:460 (-) Transcript_6805:1949-3328(-)